MQPSSPSAMPFLSATDDRLACKTFRPGAKTGDVAVASVDMAFRFKVEYEDVSSPERMAEVLERRARDGRWFAVRGSCGDPISEDGIVRRLAENGGKWVPCARSWLALDFDGVDCGRESGSDDEVIDSLRSRLPERFRDAACWWQLTSSHRVAAPLPKVYVRLWFTLDLPVTDPQAAMLIAEAGADTSLARTIQPHFLGIPQFLEGLTDPIPVRTGFIPGTLVEVGTITQVVKAKVSGVVFNPAAEDERATPSEVEAVKERALHSVVISGHRHHHMLAVAGELMLCGQSSDEISAFLAQLIQAHGRQPARGEIEGALRWVHEKRKAGKWETRGTAPASVILGSAPIDAEPAFPEDRAGSIVPTLDERIEKARDGEYSFGKNERTNAQQIMAHDDLHQPWVVSNGVIYRWDGSRYFPFPNNDSFNAHVRELVGLSNKYGDATALCLRGMVLSRWHGRQVVAPCMLPDGEAPPLYVLTKDGVLWVDDWMLDPAIAPAPHDPRLFVTSRAPVAYDVTAKCPAWLAFLDSVWKDDPEQIRELQKMFGYLLTPMTKMQKSFWLVGASNGGKGTICEVLAALVGPEQSHSMRWSCFEQEFGPQALPGKSVCIVDEANETREHRIPMKAIDFIKSVVGEGHTQINRKGKDHYSGPLPVRFVFTANEFPGVMDSSGAFGRRVQLFIFRNSFTSNPDTDMKARLLGELPGILQWGLAGLRMLLEDGKFFETKAATARWALLRRRMARTAHAVTTFVRPDPNGTVAARDLRELLSVFFRAEGWVKADIPAPVLAEQVVTQMGTAGHRVQVGEGLDGSSYLDGVTWTEAAHVVFRRNGVTLPADPFA